MPTNFIPDANTLHSTPCTLHPTPYTLHTTPHSLHPTPYTLHPTPYTLHVGMPTGREARAIQKRFRGLHQRSCVCVCERERE